MKPHPRIRKTVKWGGLVLTVLLVGVWVGSGWVQVLWESLESLRWFCVDSGIATFGWNTGDSDFGGWYTGSHPFQISLWHPVVLDLNGWSVHIAIWLPALGCLLATAIAWRLDTLARRRARQNLCPTGGCRYPRTGLAPGVVCPECGSAPAHTHT